MQHLTSGFKSNEPDLDDFKRPILKNGPNYIAEKLPSEVQRFHAINKDIDKIVEQQEESRKFFDQFTNRIQ